MQNFTKVMQKLLTKRKISDLKHVLVQCNQYKSYMADQESQDITL